MMTGPRSAAIGAVNRPGGLGAVDRQNQSVVAVKTAVSCGVYVRAGRRPTHGETINMPGKKAPPRSQRSVMNALVHIQSV